MSGRAFSILVSVALTVAAIRGAQDPQPIRVDITEVVVPVTVTDAQGRFVTGLRPDQFKLLDQGIRQDIRYFGTGQDQRYVAGFLMDLGSSMRIHWKTYQEMAAGMVANLFTPGAKVHGFLVGAGNEAELLADTTPDPQQIFDRLNTLTAGGGAALADALYLACARRVILSGEPLDPHRVIIIFGSGLDTSRTHSLDEVIELAQRNSVRIFAVSTDRDGITTENSRNLERLAAATGGRVEYPLLNTYENTAGFLPHPENEGNRVFATGTGSYSGVNWKALSASIAAITGEIQQQYILRYVPNTPGEERREHRLKVEVDLPGVHVNARPTYFTP